MLGEQFLVHIERLALHGEFERLRLVEIHDLWVEMGCGVRYRLDG